MDISGKNVDIPLSSEQVKNHVPKPEHQIGHGTVANKGDG